MPHNIQRYSRCRQHIATRLRQVAVYSVGRQTASIIQATCGRRGEKSAMRRQPDSDAERREERAAASASARIGVAER